MSAAEELKLRLEAGYVLVGLETNDDIASERLIGEVLANRKGNVWAYDNASGGEDFTAGARLDGSGFGFARKTCTRMLCDFLDLVITDCRPVDCVLVLRDVGGQLGEPEVLARIKAVARLNDQAARGDGNYDVRLIVVSSAVEFPAEIAPYGTVVSMRPPEADAIADLTGGFIDEFEIACADGCREADIVSALKGLTESGARHVLSYVMAKDGKKADRAFLSDLRKEKARYVKKSGLLELVEIPDGGCETGGMANLRAYLEHHAAIFRNEEAAAAFGVDVPRGVLIAGMPGCGKSLAAKSAAIEFGVPLLRLDMGSVMDKFVGGSERKLREALATADAVSPCVLWIDEIEKAFAGIGSSSDGGTATRLFGHFLTWMAEKRTSVFVVATANDVTNLPPELMRRGRFDELFSVDLPTHDECRQILEVHLKRRRFNVGDKVADEIADVVSERGYAGADIESLVKTASKLVFGQMMAAKESSHIDRERVMSNGEALRCAVGLVKSVKETMGEKIEELRGKLKRFGMVPA